MPATQRLFWQQPLAQLVASQTHWPATHRWPVSQAAPPPQRHAPSAQVSATVASQVRQTVPPSPQACADGATQVVPVQQPVGQLVGSQTHRPLLHRWPGEQAGLVPQRHTPLPHESALPVQARHALPLVPHVKSDEAWQTPLKQQPLGQFCASQPSQAPARQAWLEGHCWHDKP